MNITDYETFVAQIEPDGLACLTALAIKSPQPISDLCRFVRLGERKVREIMQRLMRFGYAGPVAPLDLSRWNITTKAQALLSGFFQNLLGRGSDPRQLSLQTGSDPDQLAPVDGSDPATLEDVARGAQHALIHSDQIIDQSISDHDHDSEMNETATRDVQSVAKSLDANGIRDLPGKANRSILLADGWVTPERIEAAMARARVNPLRKSPNPTGLAVAELLRHRPEVDQWIEQHSALSSDQETPADRIVAAPHPATLIRQRIAACTQQLEHATWDESDKLRAEIKQLYKDLSGALEDGAA